MNGLGIWIVVAAVALVLASSSATVEAQGPTELMQPSPSESREDCLFECRQWLESFRRRRPGGRGNRFRNRMYARCVAKCERRFWKEWDKEMDDL